MKLFILLNGIIEILAGVILFLFPRKLPGAEQVTPVGTTFTSMYGAAALAVGFFAIQVWRSYPNADLVNTLLLTLIIFHAGVMTAAFKGYRSGVKEMMGTAILHGILAVGALYFFVGR